MEYCLVFLWDIFAEEKNAEWHQTYSLILSPLFRILGKSSKKREPLIMLTPKLNYKNVSSAFFTVTFMSIFWGNKSFCCFADEINCWCQHVTHEWTESICDSGVYDTSWARAVSCWDAGQALSVWSWGSICPRVKSLFALSGVNAAQGVTRHGNRTRPCANC